MNDSSLPALFAGLGIFGIIIAVIAAIFWLWMLIDCIQNPRLDGTMKIVWLLVIFFLNALGAIIYFFVGRAGGGGKTISS
jgi:uncharacterized RDD family membrane protein YckC